MEKYNKKGCIIENCQEKLERIINPSTDMDESIIEEAGGKICPKHYQEIYPNGRE